MKFKLSISIISYDGKWSSTIYSLKWFDKKRAKELGELAKRTFEFFNAKEQYNA